jgi:hypothetical protein
MRELNENEVILDKREYEHLLWEARQYDPAPWCKPGICEGVSKYCKYTCPDSDYIQEIAAGIRAYIQYLQPVDGIEEAMLDNVKPFIREYYGCKLFEQETDYHCPVCGKVVPREGCVCRSCYEQMVRAVQES